LAKFAAFLYIINKEDAFFPSSSCQPPSVHLSLLHCHLNAPISNLLSTWIKQ